MLAAAVQQIIGVKQPVVGAACRERKIAAADTELKQLARLCVAHLGASAREAARVNNALVAVERLCGRAQSIVADCGCQLAFRKRDVALKQVGEVAQPCADLLGNHKALRDVQRTAHGRVQDDGGAARSLRPTDRSRLLHCLRRSIRVGGCSSILRRRARDKRA